MRMRLGNKYYWDKKYKLKRPKKGYNTNREREFAQWSGVSEWEAYFGNEKIGQIVGKGRAEGSRLKKEFLTKIPALKSLRDAVQKKAERGFLTGLDGRKVPVRSTHSALNTLLQSAGAIICKRWIVEMNSLLEEEFKYGEDYKQVAFVHDEVQLTVKEKYAEKIGTLAIEAIKIAGERYNFRIPLTGEFKTGQTWATTH